MAMFLGVEGLLAIAGRNGLRSYSTALGPGADGLTCFVTLVFEDHEVVEKFTEKDVAEAGTRQTAVWINHPAMMLSKFSVSQALRKHFKEAIESATLCPPVA